MAQILVLQEEPAWQEALRRSLDEYHTLSVVSNTDEAVDALLLGNYDLVISRVHFETQSFHKAIMGLRAVCRPKDVPLVCFCGVRTAMGRAVNQVVSKIATTLGADKYIALDDFITGDKCDLEGIRVAIEDCLRKPVPNKSGTGG
jgi:hypothetical protein